MVVGIIVTMIDRCAWFGHIKPAAERLKKLQCLAVFTISLNLSHERWPNHANLVCHPCPTTYPWAGAFGLCGRAFLLHPPPFHELIPRLWIHQPWRPLTP